MNLDICVVSEQTLHVYDFLQDGESEKELLKRAEDNATKWGRSDTYKVMTFETYMELKRKKYISMPLNEISEERYEEMLDVLPPLKYGRNGGVESFFCSEYYDGTFTNQYAKHDGKFYQKLADITDPSTWIHNFLV